MKSAPIYPGALSAIALFLLLTTFNLPARNDERGFIYGRITTSNDHVYTGVIRWGGQEAFWDDLFNSEKRENRFETLLDDDAVQRLDEDRRRRRRAFWDRMDGVTYHQFKCFFGDLTALKVTGRSSALLTFRNGEEMEVTSGSNDMGADIQVLDESLGLVELRWRRISTIEFMATPAPLSAKFGDPLYGVVETRRGKFEGFIQWDLDECLTTDEINGEHEDGKMNIAFGKIAKIEKYRGGAMVILRSGSELYLDDSNDVDDENRGIVVKDRRYGRVVIQWREFQSLTLDDDYSQSPLPYESFQAAKQLSGTVITRDGDRFSGRLAYDLDESMGHEILDGEQDRITYRIPFRDIDTIQPQRDDAAFVKLRNGEELTLEASRDVNEENDGVLIFMGRDETIYIPWEKIAEIQFN